MSQARKVLQSRGFTTTSVTSRNKQILTSWEPPKAAGGQRGGTGAPASSLSKGENRALRSRSATSRHGTDAEAGCCHITPGFHLY